jgi:hypothetical protein
VAWARNIKRRISHGALADLTYRSSSAFALAWNAFRNQLPTEVIDSFDEYFKKSRIYRMDPTGKTRKGKARGTYVILDDEESPIEFRDVELCPPSGFFGANYTRYIQLFTSRHLADAVFRYIHDERCAHLYGVSWTTIRETRREDAGGHFFIADYGIMVCAARDTVTVWKPREYHGTGLAHCAPEASDPGYYQAGLAIVTPISVTNAWKRVRDGKISAEQAEIELVSEKAF